MTAVNIGKGIEIEIDFSAIPQAAIDHILYIGARNILMDSHAGVNAKALPDLSAENVVDQSRATAEKKLAALYRGEVRSATTRESVDPVRAEALRMAQAVVTAAIRKAGAKVADYPKDQLRAAAEKVLAKDPSILEQAAKRVAEAKANAPTIDLSDLGL